MPCGDPRCDAQGRVYYRMFPVVQERNGVLRRLGEDGILHRVSGVDGTDQALSVYPTSDVWDFAVSPSGEFYQLVDDSGAVSIATFTSSGRKIRDVQLRAGSNAFLHEIQLKPGAATSIRVDRVAVFSSGTSWFWA